MPTSFPFACPHCHAPLQQISTDQLVCPGDGLLFARIDGIWRFILTDEAGKYEQFIHEYEIIRRAEGRASPHPAYYRSLPYKDLSGKMSAQWRIRAASYDALRRSILEPAPPVLTILDLGAGNCWLSNRLAAQGHQVLSLDLVTNDFDGLGCFRHYETNFTPAQAEFDRLPCQDQSADLVIYNASLHYSVDVRATLSEALRVLRPGGRIILLDSPIYQQAESGASMVRERENQFFAEYGFPSNSLKSVNFFTYTGLESLARDLNITWNFLTPFYGIGWMLKPVISRLLGRREPAKFHLVIGKPVMSPAVGDKLAGTTD
ncbi:MAG TPA: methyltransferase domain-containing protein [Anaerolineales bacterium]|jgi:SAM-dependent methyltransferase